MPEVYVHAIEGRSKEQKRALIKDITEAVVKNFGVTADAVLVEILESSSDNKARAAYCSASASSCAGVDWLPPKPVRDALRQHHHGEVRHGTWYGRNAEASVTKSFSVPGTLLFAFWFIERAS
jgi:4-oxalocrotonate tautomerase